MKHTFLFVAAMSILTIPAFANTAITGQTYVDTQDAQIVYITQCAGNNNEDVGRTLVVNSFGILELSVPAAPTPLCGGETD